MLRALPWKLIGFSALGLALALMFAALKMERAQNLKLKTQIERCSEGRRNDRAAYEQAQRTAAAENKAEVARIEAEQQKVNDDIQSDLNARLERLRRELRAQAAGGDSGGAGSSADGAASGGASGEAQVCVPASKYVLAGEYEEKLDQWITWYERQSAIR